VCVGIRRWNRVHSRTFSQCCPRGKSSSRILEDHFTSACSCSWAIESSKILSRRTRHSANSLLPRLWSREVHNSVNCHVHHSSRGYGDDLLIDIKILLMSVSKSFFTVIQCCCSRGKSLSSNISLQVLVFVLYLSSNSRTLWPI